MGDLDLGEDLGPRQLVDLVGEVVGGRVGLHRQLQLGDDLLVDRDLEGHVADGLRVGEPALDLGYPEPPPRVVPDELPDLVDGLDDVLHLEEDALPPHHVADLEGYLLLLLEDPVDGLLVVLVLALDGRPESVLGLLLELLRFPEEHLLLYSDHGLPVGAVRVELEPHFCLDCQLEAGLPDKLLEFVPRPLGYCSVVQDDPLQLSLFVLCAVEF